MNKKLIKITLFIIVSLSLVSCKNTQEKMQDYVTTYNNSAALVRNEIITNTSAEIKSPTEINIVFETNIENSEEYRSIYNQIFPPMLSALLQKDKTTMDLIDEGVKLNIAFLAKDNSLLINQLVDKTKMNELIKKQGTSLTTTINENSNDQSQMEVMLQVVNKNMPIINKEDGTKITKININEKNELVYNVEIGDDIAEVLKSEAAKDLIKENLLRSNGLKNVFSSFSRFDINTVKYSYQDTKGKVINEITIRDKDLKR